MEKWEYNHFTSNETNVIDKLNTLGRHGWQCYAVTVESTVESISGSGMVVNTLRYHLKRSLPC